MRQILARTPTAPARTNARSGGVGDPVGGRAYDARPRPGPIGRRPGCAPVSLFQQKLLCKFRLHRKII
jgi:hypothetical protein